MGILFKRPFKRRQKLTSPERNPVRRTSSGGRPTAFSYYASRSQTELNIGRESRSDSIDRSVQHRISSRLRKLRDHVGLVAGGTLLLGVVVYQMQLSSTPHVVSIIPAPDAPFLQDTKVYQQAAGKLIDSSIANRNKLTINTSGIAAAMRQQFPELQSVTVSLPFLGDKPTVYVRPADPALVLVAASDSFVIDQRGRALTEARSQAQLTRLNIPTVTDQSNLSFKLGDQVLSRQTTMFIRTIAQQHRAHNTDIKAMTLPAAASELDVYPADAPYFIKYSIHNNDEAAAAQQAGSYFAVRKHLEDKNLVPQQYVDARLQGRVYYK